MQPAPEPARDLVAAVKRIQRAGLEIPGGFMVVFDRDTPVIFARQTEFILQAASSRQWSAWSKSFPARNSPNDWPA